MDLTAALSNLLLGVSSQPVAVVLVIVLATFVLEDVATVTVAVLASQMLIDGSIAIAALIVGTILGDLAVFFTARRASHLPIIARLLNGPTLQALLGWLERHALAMVLVARFTPGLRLPVFAGSGSIGMSARAFTLVIVLSTLIWTPGLYYAATALGMAGLDWYGGYGRMLPAVLIVLVAVAPRVITALVIRQGAPAQRDSFV